MDTSFASGPAQQLGSQGNFYYQAYPKADGGYDYIRTTGSYGTGYTPQSIAALQPFSISQADVQKELASGQAGGTGGGATAPNVNEQLIQGQLGRLDNQRNIGQQNILDQYNAALQTLTNNQALAQRNYDTAVTQNQSDNQTAKANIDTGVRNNLTSLQRLLGSRGAGYSSAALTLAPYAAGREGSIQRGQVQDTFAKNQSALDTNWGDVQNQFTNARGGLDAQKQNQQNSLLAQLDQVRSNLLGQQANPDVNQINSLGSQIDNLGRQVTFTPQAVNTATPDLSKYDYSQNATPTAANQTGIGQSINPYQYLLGGQQRKLSGQSLIA